MVEFKRDLEHFNPVRGDYLVEVVDSQDNKIGSIIIPDSKKEPFRYGAVIKRGNGMATLNGQFVEPVGNVGDVVLFGLKAGFDIYLDNKKFVVVSEDKIVGYFRETA